MNSAHFYNINFNDNFKNQFQIAQIYSQHKETKIDFLQYFQIEVAFEVEVEV